MALSSRNDLNVVSDTANKSANFVATGSYTVGSGTEFLAVKITYLCNTDVFNVTGVTWDGAALTFVTGSRFRSANDDMTTEWWYIVDPTAGGPADIAATFQETTATSTVEALAVSAVEVIGGVDTGDPIGAVDGLGALDQSSANAHISLTTTRDGSLVLSGAGGRGADTSPFAPQAGITTELLDATTGPNTVANDIGYWMGEALTTTAGAYDVGATMSAADTFGVSAFEVKAAVAADSVGRGLTDSILLERRSLVG